MSADTYACEHCGGTVFEAHRAHHERSCPELARLARKRKCNLERMRAKRRGLPTRRGKTATCALKECGVEFTSQGVTHRYCCPAHADRARWGENLEAAEKERHALEMAPLKREAELVRRAAEAVPLLSPEANYALWLRCLGVAA